MARQWRLRHKLLLGLLLVVASLGLMLLGTLTGLRSYIGTIDLFDSKMVEWAACIRLTAAAEGLGRQPAGPDSPARVDQKVRAVKDALQKYKEELDETVRRRRDPNPQDESDNLQAVREALAGYENALAAARGRMDGLVTGASVVPSQTPEVLDRHRRMMEAVNGISKTIGDTMWGQIHTARRDYRWSLWATGSACCFALLLLLLLMRQFRDWVFVPIRQLQAGVQRVGGGDFAHPIGLRSGDELQELADAFDDVVGRLSEIYRDLARQVNERSRQLVRSERMVSVGFLAAGVAHEINNPLASIAFCGEALDRRLRPILAGHPEDGETASKYLRMIQQEAFRCKEITSKLLEFSRVGERRREPTDLAELVQGVLEIAQHLQSCRGKTVRFEPAGRPAASVNAQDLKSVVLNLVVNALDSMDEGGTLTIALRADAAWAEAVFADTGCGMPAEVLENIFEPFYTRNRTGKGTGLGLFISHQIIDQHGGSIQAFSPGPGRGSTFVVRVPTRPAVEPGQEEQRGHAAA